jgi:hypothetical protein
VRDGRCPVLPPCGARLKLRARNRRPRVHHIRRRSSTGVSKAIANVNNVIGPALAGRDVKDQKALDDFMVQSLDGSKSENGWTKSKLGANAILGVSMAACRAGAAAAKVPLYQYIAHLAGASALGGRRCGARINARILSFGLVARPVAAADRDDAASRRPRLTRAWWDASVPRLLSLPVSPRPSGSAGKPTDKFVLPVPFFNVINGGEHAGNALAFQEFMLAPTGASSFTEAMRMGSEVYHHLGKIIKAKYGQDSVNVGGEGGERASESRPCR